MAVEDYEVVWCGRGLCAEQQGEEGECECGAGSEEEVWGVLGHGNRFMISTSGCSALLKSITDKLGVGSVGFGSFLHFVDQRGFGFGQAVYG